MKMLELFAGIGGVAAAADGRATIVQAIDISQLALSAYRHNFSHPTTTAEIESIPSDRWKDWSAELWWMSPPCQPFTRRGNQADDLDPRTRAFFATMSQVRTFRPEVLMLENVPGFERSRTYALMTEVLRECGYRWWQGFLCPTSFGVPNRRKRFFLVASRNGLPVYEVPTGIAISTLGAWLEHDSEPGEEVEATAQCRLSPTERQRFGDALPVANWDDSVTNCFTASYGRSPWQSGSYVRTETGVRRFTPREVARLMGFPRTYSMPPSIPLRRQWALWGNSVSVPVVQFLLAPWLA